MRWNNPVFPVVNGDLCSNFPVGSQFWMVDKVQLELATYTSIIVSASELYITSPMVTPSISVMDVSEILFSPLSAVNCICNFFGATMNYALSFFWRVYAISSRKCFK